MTNADFSIADVLAWARTKPADERYDYWCDKCAIGQFLVETNRAAAPTMGGTCYYEDGRRYEFADALNQAAHCEGYGLNHTFGGFVTRLEALCPVAPVAQSQWTRLDAYLTDIELASA